MCLSIFPEMWLHTVLLAPSLANSRPVNCTHLAGFECIINNILEWGIIPTHHWSGSVSEPGGTGQLLPLLWWFSGLELLHRKGVPKGR